MGEKDELNRLFIGEEEIDTSGIHGFPQKRKIAGRKGVRKYER